MNHEAHEGSRRNSWWFPSCTFVSFVVEDFLSAVLILLLVRVAFDPELNQPIDELGVFQT